MNRRLMLIVIAGFCLAGAGSVVQTSNASAGLGRQGPDLPRLEWRRGLEIAPVPLDETLLPLSRLDAETYIAERLPDRQYADHGRVVGFLTRT